MGTVIDVPIVPVPSGPARLVGQRTLAVTTEVDGRHPARGMLEHRCRRCGGLVTPQTEAHAVAWCGRCRRVGIARVSLAD